MKKLLFVVLILAVPCFNVSAERQLVDAIAAVVDQEIILISEIQGMIGPALQEMQKNSQSAEEYNRQARELMGDALNQIIETKILYREALRSAVQVTDDAIEKRMQEIRDEFETEEAFMDYLNTTGLTLGELRDRRRKELLANYMMYLKRQEMLKAIVINESDVTDYFETNKEQFVNPERIRVRQIMLRAGRDTAEREQAKARLELLRDEIQNGASFEELAKKYSEAPGSESGGMIGWQKRGDLIPELENAIFHLPDGSVSEVVESPFGVHLLKIDERQSESAISIKEARAQIEPALREAQVGERITRWMSDLRKTSNVRVYL